MLLFIENYGGGQAINLIVRPSTDATRWKILRKTTNTFSRTR